MNEFGAREKQTLIGNIKARLRSLLEKLESYDCDSTAALKIFREQVRSLNSKFDQPSFLQKLPQEIISLKSTWKCYKQPLQLQRKLQAHRDTERNIQEQLQQEQPPNVFNDLMEKKQELQPKLADLQKEWNFQAQIDSLLDSISEDTSGLDPHPSLVQLSHFRDKCDEGLWANLSQSFRNVMASALGEIFLCLLLLET